MIIMVTVLYPPHKSTNIAKLYLKQPREVPYVTKWRVFNALAGKDGVKQYHLIYTERGKGEEAIINIIQSSLQLDEKGIQEIPQSKKMDVFKELLTESWKDNMITQDEEVLIEELRVQLGISPKEYINIKKKLD